MNPRVASIPASVTLGVDSRAKELAAAGQKIFAFAAGEPDFDTPLHIKQAAIDALTQGKTGYAPVAGLPELKAAIAAKLLKENGLRYSPGQVVVSIGAKHSLFNLFMALCGDGDEVIIPSPYWLSYPEMVRVAGGVPVFVECREENGLKMTPADLKAALTPRTKALVLNSPCNPTGVVYSREEIRALCELAVAQGVYIVSDEIYEKLVFDGAEHVSAGALSDTILERTITVNGFSKSYAMTGWRLGYLAGPSDLVKAVTALQSHSTSGATTFAQYGALAALRGGDASVEEMAREFAGRREYLYNRITKIKGVTCVNPHGAFYLFPRISHFGMDSVTFAARLLESQGVAVVPGAAFGADENIRLSYACSMDNIQGGMDRLETFVRELSS